MSSAAKQTNGLQSGPEILDHTLIFGQLEESLKAQIFGLLSLKSFEPLSEIVKEGDFADGLYIVQHGTLSVLVQNRELDLNLEVSALGAGEIFGEMALLTGEKRSATVRAKTKASCYFLSKETFQKLSKNLPSISMGIAQTLAQRLSQQNKASGIEFKKLSGFQFDTQVYGMFPDNILKKHKAIPLKLEGKTLTIAMVNPTDTIAFDELKRCLRSAVLKPVAVSGDDYDRFIARNAGSLAAPRTHFEFKKISVDPKKVDLYNEAEDQNRLKLATNGQETITLLNTLVAEALEYDASDIHICPGPNGLELKYRVDGILHERKGLIPVEYASTIISRLKVLAKMNPLEKSKPQDGRISLRYENRDYDLRIATLPVRLGEKATLRILDSSSGILEIDQLILASQVAQLVEQMVNKPHGLVLVTGPTGSGKTTTMYSLLKSRMKSNAGKIAIATIEDPIEYNIPGITQTEVNLTQDLSFHVALRALLRHDPDLIMVGETRDPATAATVCQAALTGHAVISSMHTNGALETIFRLEDLGVEPHMVLASLNGVIAQRLVRRICPSCTQTKKVPEVVFQSLRDRNLIKDSDGALNLKEGRGCKACEGTGFQGRVGIYEVLPINDEFRDAYLKKLSKKELLQIAAANNMVGMNSYARFLLKNGITTATEVLRALG